jgi:hypothetical protein
MVPGTVAVLLLIVLVTGVMLSKALSGGFMRQMLFQVVQVFLHQDAIGINNAKTLGQLGLRPPGHENEPQKSANYPPALQMLIQAGVIRTAENDRLYLSKEYSPHKKGPDGKGPDNRS